MTVLRRTRFGETATDSHHTVELLIFETDTIDASSFARGVGLTHLRRVFEHREPPLRNYTLVWVSTT